MERFFSCTKCSEVIIKSLGKSVKVRGKVLIFRDDKAYTVCKGCGVDVEVPLKIDLDALPISPTPQLYIKK